MLFFALRASIFPSIATILLELAIGLLLLGPVLASFHESYVHDIIGHARKSTRDWWKRHPRLFLPLIEGFFLHHIVHHGKTFREGYLSQFGETLDPAKVDEWAPRVFYSLFDEKDREWVRKKVSPQAVVLHLKQSEYGLGAASGLKFASTIVPLALLLLLVLPFWLALGADLAMLLIYPAMSNLIHRNIMHIDQLQPLPGPRRQGRFLNWLWGSAYMKALERWHWMHHEYVLCNFNLFVFADFFRGTRRKPTQQDLNKMAAEGLAMDRWLDSFRRYLQRIARGHSAY